YVNRANSFADGSSERALNTENEFFNRRESFFRKILSTVSALRFFASVNFAPMNFLFAAIRFFYSHIENSLRGGPNIRPSSITFNKCYDGLIGHLDLSIR